MRISPWPTIVVVRFSGRAGRDWERIDREFVRFESERVTWLPQNDFHLVLSRQRDQFVRVSALAFDESFRQHGTVHTYGKPLLFHFPALRFLVLSRHSLAKVSSPFFLLREEINLVAFFYRETEIPHFIFRMWNQSRKFVPRLFASRIKRRLLDK